MFQNALLLALERDQNSSPVSSNEIDDLMERLKFLQIEISLFREMKMKPFSRYYFMSTTNSGEQFFIFVSVCAWLIRKTGQHFDDPKEFDDPSLLIAKIIRLLQEMDVPTDFPSNKLLQGAGPICIFILDCLATQALKIAKSNLSIFEISKEEDIPVEMLENDSEIILEKVEEENALIDDESDDERESSLNFKLSFNNNKPLQKAGTFDVKLDSDNESWRLELEHVLPQLKIFVKSDPRDWRAHIEQMKTFKTNIDTAADDTKSHLNKMQKDIVYTMEKAESREKHLNNDFKTMIAQYKTLSTELIQVSGLIKQYDNEKLEKEQELLDLLNEVEAIKTQMEQRGNTMTDGSPIINIKKSIIRIKEDISDMDLQIGVLDHIINTDAAKQNIQKILL